MNVLDLIKYDLATDIYFLVKSIGFAISFTSCEKGCWYKGEYKKGIYYRMLFTGGVNEIPVKIKRKMSGERQQIKDPLVTGITVTSIGIKTYYGFGLEKNGRYLLEDFRIMY